ncbi:MAG: DNA primase [Lewinella sp.]|nr:DNA primase [Lewinella sp.]
MEATKVEEVVQDFVTLKRRGVNLLGLCPFHNEKTPSFTVSPAKNIYKCFGCGKSGDGVRFLMDHEHYTFPEAIRHLARKYNIEIEEKELSPETLAEMQYTDSLYIVNQFALEYYQHQLHETDLGKSVGLSYFKKRGFREDTMRKFGLGFAPEQGSALTDAAVKAGHTVDFLQKVGLTTQNQRDFFRNRVMFAIHNLSGKVIGFGGRILQKDVKAPKYINTPETEIYNKSKVLYGAFFAKQAIRQQDECILVEGYTDVISLHQAGIQNVVASSGTSLTTDQIRLIKRYTPNVKIIYDGDFAGIKAALRGVDLLLEQDLNVRIVLLPEGEDPDSYLQSVGAAVFTEYVADKSKDFVLFKADLLMKETAGDPIRRSEVIKDIVGSISRVPDPIKRALYVRECARIVEVEEQLLVNEVNKTLSKRISQERLKSAPEAPGFADSGFPDREPGMPPPAAEPEKPAVIGDEFQERDIVRLLVLSGEKLFDAAEGTSIGEYILANIADIIDYFDNPFYHRIVMDARSRLESGQKLEQAYFLNHPDEEIRQLAFDFVASPYELSEGWEKRFEITLQTQKMPEDNFVKDTLQGLNRFRQFKITRLSRENLSLLTKYQKEGNVEQQMVYMKVHLKLEEIRTALAREFGTVVTRHDLHR